MALKIVSEDDAKEMRRRYEAGEDLREISVSYGINYTTVRDHIRKVGGVMRTRGNRTGTMYKPVQNDSKMSELLIDILMHSCGQFSEAEKIEFNDGFQRYTIDVHCVGFEVNAKYHPDKDVWEIRDWTKRDI